MPQRARLSTGRDRAATRTCEAQRSAGRLQSRFTHGRSAEDDAGVGGLSRRVAAWGESYVDTPCRWRSVTAATCKPEERKPRSAAIEAISAGVAEADKRAAGPFDGLLGSLPDGASKALNDILGYLGYYLLNERQCNQALIRKLLEAHIRNPIAALRVKELQDEGIRVAIGILAALSSVLNVKDGVLNPKDPNGRPIHSKPLTKDEAMWWLLSGSVGLRDFHRQQGTRKERRPKISLVDTEPTKSSTGFQSRTTMAKCPRLDYRRHWTKLLPEACQRAAKTPRDWAQTEDDRESQVTIGSTVMSDCTKAAEIRRPLTKERDHDYNTLLRLPEVISATGLGRDTIYRYIREGRFPAQRRITDRASAWRADEVAA